MITVIQRQDGDALIFELFDEAIGDVPLARAFLYPDGYIPDVHTEVAFRGRGYGKALMLELVKQAEEIGFTRLSLDVSRWNSSAIYIYESAGFMVFDKGLTFYRMEWTK